MKNEIENDILKERKIERAPDVRGDYFRDQTAIIHSMPFRRLKHKTQVFFSPENDHICTRIEHVQHVATIAATICKGLNKNGWDLDQELAYAIGLGHDLGHAPFGHAGEEALTKCIGKQFMHELNSLRVVDVLANNGKGINLTFAVRDGIVCHNGEKFEQKLSPAEVINDLDKIVNRKIIPSTWEGCVVRFSDKIAYLGRDIEDAIIAKIIKEEDVPSEITSELGNKNGEIINTLVIDLIESSKAENCIKFSDERFELFDDLKVFNYENIYKDDKILDYKIFVERMITSIFEYLQDLFCKYGYEYEGYEKEKLKISNSFGRYIKKMRDVYQDDNNVPNQILSDYISGMTDSFVINAMEQISLPTPLVF